MFRMHDNDEFLLLTKVEDPTDEPGSGVNRQRRWIAGKLDTSKKTIKCSESGLWILQ